MKKQYVVIYARVITNDSNGRHNIEYFSDLEKLQTLNAAISHGFNLLKSDDFNIGVVVGRKLVQLNWMAEKKNEPSYVLAKIAEQIGLTQ